MEMRFANSLDDHQRGEWMRLLTRNELASAHQMPEFLQWWDGLVPGARHAGYWMGYSQDCLVAAGAMYEPASLTGANSTNVRVCPRGPFALNAESLLDFIRLLKEGSGSATLVINPYGLRDAALVAQLEAEGFKARETEWIDWTCLWRIDKSDEELMGSVSGRARTHVRAARQAGAEFRLVHDPEVIATFAQNQSRLAEQVGIEPTPVEYAIRSCGGDTNWESGGIMAAVFRGDRMESAGIAIAVGSSLYSQKGWSPRPSIGAEYYHFELAKLARGHGKVWYDLGGILSPKSRDGITRFKLQIAQPSLMNPVMEWRIR